MNMQVHWHIFLVYRYINNNELINICEDIYFDELELKKENENP